MTSLRNNKKGISRRFKPTHPNKKEGPKPPFPDPTDPDTIIPEPQPPTPIKTAPKPPFPTHKAKRGKVKITSFHGLTLSKLNKKYPQRVSILGIVGNRHAQKKIARVCPARECSEDM